MDSHPETQVANSEIAAYAGLLRIRKKWALIGIVAFGIVFVICSAVLLGMAWTLGDKAVTRLTTLTVVMVFVFPFVWGVHYVAEYRRLNGLLELLDVLQRAASRGELERRTA